MTTEAPAATTTAPRTAQTVFAWLAAITVVDILVQVFLAGVGIFGIKVGVKVEDASSFDPHRVNADVIALLALLMIIAAGFARWKQAIWGSVVLLILTIVVQSLLAGAGDSNKWVGGLHALDGMIILGLAGWLHFQSRKYLRR